MNTSYEVKRLVGPILAFPKRYFFLLSISFINLQLVAQSIEYKLGNYYSKLSLDIPADQVFIHIDRNLYHAGDTIRFQAYVRDRQTGIFDTKSISLHVLLLDPAQKTIDSARFRINNSTATGWLKVPEEVQTNNYSIIAFTSTMMNFDPKFISSIPIRIDKLRPVQPTSIQKSEEERSVTFQQLVKQESIDLRFLPEGGTFIYGIKQRLAFNALSSVGSQLNIEGEIINQKDEKIFEFKTGPNGPGLLEFTPEPGYTYFASIWGKDFIGIKWPLPIPENAGVALRVNSSGNGIINIGVEGKNVAGSSYLISLIMNNIVVLSREFKLDSTFRFKIGTSELPSGTAYISLFNNDLKPVAERMVFINHHKKMDIGITTSALSYNRGEETELTINTTNTDGKNVSSIVSVSVIDSISGYYNRFPFPDIESTFLFEKDFYDNLPGRIKLKGLSNIDDQGIDLLLMTYGWRKFNLKELSDTTIVRELKNYDYLKIKNPAPDKKARNEIKVVALEGIESFSLIPDKNHEAILGFDSLSANIRQVMIMPDKNNLKNAYPVNVEFPENKTFTENAKQNKIDNIYFETNISFQKKPESDFGLDSAIIIDPVTIKGTKKPPKEYYNKYVKQYEGAHLMTLTYKDLVGCLTFEDVLTRLHLYRVDVKRKLVYTGLSRIGISFEPPAALIILDDSPLWSTTMTNTGVWKSSYETIADMPASQIYSVTVLKGLQGFYIYGQEALGGVVFVVTKFRQMAGSEKIIEESANNRINDDNMKPIRIFRSEVEYYIPKKEEVLNIPEFQYRPTILWKNEVFLDGTGPIKIKYPNNIVKSTAIVIVNGVSFTNLVGSNIYRYKIK